MHIMLSNRMISGAELRNKWEEGQNPQQIMRQTRSMVCNLTEKQKGDYWGE